MLRLDFGRIKEVVTRDLAHADVELKVQINSTDHKVP